MSDPQEAPDTTVSEPYLLSVRSVRFVNKGEGLVKEFDMRRTHLLPLEDARIEGTMILLDHSDSRQWLPYEVDDLFFSGAPPGGGEGFSFWVLSVPGSSGENKSELSRRLTGGFPKSDASCP